MKHMKQLIALLLALVLCLGLLAGCASKTTDDTTTPSDTTPADDTSKDTTEGGEDATTRPLATPTARSSSRRPVLRASSARSLPLPHLTRPHMP